MSKFIIYQLLPRLYSNNQTANVFNGSLKQNGCGKLNDFNSKALNAIKQLGVSHIWFTGVIEHATQTDYSTFGIRKDHDKIVKGKAGSAYAIKDYYDIDPDLAVDVVHRMMEFENLVQRVHDSGLKMIIDFVPNHVAREYYSDAKPDGVIDLGEGDNVNWHFSPLNNFYYFPNEQLTADFDLGGYDEYPAKATGNDQFSSHPDFNDWYETVKLNYGVHYTGGREEQFEPIPSTWHKMLDILLFWASKNVDGFRCDMAEMVPVAFWKWSIAKVKEFYPNVQFIAEVYNPDLYRTFIFEGGFDYLYDKVGMYDTLKEIVCHQKPAWTISNEWQKLQDVSTHMLEFFENHDEQRIASDFFAGNPEKAYPAIIVLAMLNTSPLMIYSGQEFGESGMDQEGYSGRDGRTTIFDYWGVKSIQSFVNQGKFDGALLSREQTNVYEFYQKVCTICLNNKAIKDGKMFDLQYANFDNPSFDPSRQFAWLRCEGDERLIILVNFEEQEKDLSLNIPTEALEYIGVNQGETFNTFDLLSNTDLNYSWKAGENLQIKLKPNNGVVCRLC